MKKTIRVGLIGYGTVGQGVAKILETNRAAVKQRVGADVELAAVCDLRQLSLPGVAVTKRYRDLIEADDIDLIVELIGGYEPARTVILDALNAGKHVVTANKAVMSKYWDEVLGAAQANERLVYFEASVGGAIPVIQGLNEGMAANRIEKISGILNGTTNYILSEMGRQGIDFATALKKSQEAGFAEADPTFDIDGIDTAHKLAILSSLAWSGWVRLSDIPVSGIRDIAGEDVFFAKKFGYVIKLLGSARMTKGGLELAVEPCLVDLTHTFANVDSEYNAVLVHGDASGDIMFYGKGAGQLPAASAVVSDVIFLSRQIANGTAGKVPYITCNPRKKTKILPVAKGEGAFYVRFTAADRPGVLSKVSGILSQHKVSIATVYQEEAVAGSGQQGVPIIMLTHRTTRGNLSRALKQIDRLSVIKAPTVSLRVEG